jgi:hypothetical protein
MTMKQVGIITMSVKEYRLADSGDITPIDITATIDGTM